MQYPASESPDLLLLENAVSAQNLAPIDEMGVVPRTAICGTHPVMHNWLWRIWRFHVYMNTILWMVSFDAIVAFIESNVLLL